MKNQVMPSLGRTESIVIPLPKQSTDTSSISPPDAVTDKQWTDDGQDSGQNCTFTFKQASKILGCNESTLRRRYWQEKVEPAFKHCPIPLRTIARYNRDDQPVFEFSKFGLEVLKAFLAAKSEGSEDKFLIEARRQYPAPIESISQKQDDVSLSPTEVISHSSIQVLNPDQCIELDRLAALAESMQVYKPSQVDLNGSQDEILGLLTVVATKVGDMEQTNLERLAALGDRKQKLATAENVLAHFINVGKGLESQAAQINDEAKEVASKESDLKKLLDAMQATLS
jgi:hypothetical protein